MNLLKRTSLAAAIGVGLLGATSANAFLLIDSFDEPAPQITNNTGGNDTVEEDEFACTGGAATGCYTGSRDLSSWVESNPNPGAQGHQVAVLPVGDLGAVGVGDHSQDTSVFAHTWIQWDGADGAGWNAPGAGFPTAYADLISNLDFTGPSTNLLAAGGGIQTTFVTADHRTQVVYYVFDSAGNVVVGTDIITGADQGGVFPFNSFIPWGSFNNGAAVIVGAPALPPGGVNAVLSDATAIQLHMHSLQSGNSPGHQDLQAQIDQIAVVPEPMTPALLGGGLISLLWATRRRARKAA